MEEEEKGEATDGDLREGGMHSTSLLDEELALLLQQESLTQNNGRNLRPIRWKECLILATSPKTEPTALAVKLLTARDF